MGTSHSRVLHGFQLGEREKHAIGSAHDIACSLIGLDAESVLKQVYRTVINLYKLINIQVNISNIHIINYYR